MASASSSCQGLLEKISPGSPQDLLLEEAVHARIYDENVCPGTSADVLCEPAQSKGTCTSHKSNFVREVTGRMPGPNPGTRVLHEPAQSKCTWTSHKHVYARIYGENASQNEMHMDMSQEPFYARIYRNNAAGQRAYPIQPRP